MGASNVWAPLAQALLGTPAFTPLDVAREAGLDLDEARRLWRALGFPPVGDDERVFTRADVEIVRAVRALLEIAGRAPRRPPPAHARHRAVAGARRRRAGDGGRRSAGAAPRRRPCPDEAALAELVERIAALAPSLEQFLGYVWRRHLLAALRRRSAAPVGRRPPAHRRLRRSGRLHRAEPVDRPARARGDRRPLRGDRLRAHPGARRAGGEDDRRRGHVRGRRRRRSRPTSRVALVEAYARDSRSPTSASASRAARRCPGRATSTARPSTWRAGW